MSKRLFSFFSMLALVAMLAAPTTGISLAKTSAAPAAAPQAAAPQMPATQGGDNPGRHVVAPTPFVAPDVPEDAEIVDPILHEAEGPVQIMIELADEPTTVAYANTLTGNSQTKALQAAKTQLARIEAAQQLLLAPLATLDAKVIYRVQRVYNGIAVVVDAANLAKIAELPGVKAIHRLTPKTIDHTTSVPLIGAPQVWTTPGLGLTGAGVTIGIIDSGVDYIHADFGGPATSAAYAANNTTVITDTYNGKLLFPTAKVVGGWDFAGDDYDANSSNSTYQPIPHPDPDPAACLTGGGSADHGTHVAGTAAGYGVKSDGTTYTGAYNSSLDMSQFRIGPGVAPQAKLYSLRVFGCNGSTNLVDVAIEWAMDPNQDGDLSDHLDVINMSLGSAYGSGYDSTAVASDNAALAGMIVVASAGNETDLYYVTGSPGTASRVLSVASSRDKSNVLDGFRVNAPSSIAGVYAASLSVAYNWDSLPGITGTLVYPSPGSNPAQDQRTGCYDFDIDNRAVISGNIVLLDWTEPSCGSSVVRTGKAFAAGAKGVLIADNSTIFDLRITGSSVIPSVSIPKSVGDMLKANLTGLNVSLVVDYRNATLYVDPTIEDTMSSFSSRGPRRVDTMLKPDITAPGDSIFSAYNGTGNEGLNYSGTSMAAPHMAGAMALLRQLHPTWTVEELKALLMNGATSDTHTDPPAAPINYSPARIGAGRANLVKSAVSPLIAYVNDNSGLVSVSFGAPEVSAPLTVYKDVRVVNKGTTPATYSLYYQGVVNMPGVTYSVSPSVIKLGPGGYGTVRVTMTANPDLMEKTMDPAVDPNFGGAPRQWMSEASGYLMIEPGVRANLPYKLFLPLVLRNYTGAVIPLQANTPTTLRLPVYAAPRAVGSTYAIQKSLAFTTTTATTSIGLAGTAVPTFTGYPLVTAFELQEISPNDPETEEIMDAGDLKYIGVANDYWATGVVTRTNIYFGIASWGEHSSPTPYDTEYDIYIDTTLDGNADYALYNTFYPNGNSPSDIFLSRLYNLNTGAAAYVNYINGFSGSVDTGIFNSSLMILPVPASALGLTAASPNFTYWIKAYNRELLEQSVTSDVSGVHQYTAAKPGLDFSGGYPGMPVWEDLPGKSIPVRFDAAAYKANNSLGVLLLHHHNGLTSGAEIIPVSALADLAVINILHTNDFHGQLEPSGSNPGIARLATTVNMLRAAVDEKNVLLVDGGDEMQGSLLSNLKKGEPTIDLFNTLGYKFATFGNHEFDWGQQVLISRTQQANYPFLAANLVVSDSGSCATAGWTTPAFAQPWTTVTVGKPGNQVVIGIIGVTSQETPYITVAEATQGLCFKDAAESVIHYYDAVKAAGAKAIIVLSHLGNTDGGYGYGIPVYGDQTLARKLVEQGKKADLIIGAHSHTNLSAAQVVSGTTVVQAYYNGRKVGRAVMTINKATGAVTVNWQSLSVSTTGAQDPTARARLATWTSDPAYQAQINQIIGYTNVPLVRRSTLDNMMGTFVNDAIYNQLNSDAETLNDADMVFNNSGGLRADITGTYPLTLTYGALFTVLPFGNQTIVGDMTGAQIYDLLNQSATLFKGTLQIAGIRFAYYSYGSPTTFDAYHSTWWAWGAYSITVKNRNTGLWEPLVMTKTYRVATNEFLAPAGQDGFTPFKYMTNISYWGDMLNQVLAWVSAHHATPATAYNGPNNDGNLDGRITREGNDSSGPIIPVTILHHNDSHGRLLPSGSNPGYTNLVTLIRQEWANNPQRTILLNGGDQIQGDAMAAFYKAAFTGKGSDGTTLPITLTTNPIIAAMNAMTYTAMTLGNHEYNFGGYIFTGTLGQANFPLLQANVYDDGRYGLAEVNVRPFVTTTVGPEGIKVAILGIGNHRIPNYELPSNIPGLTFTNPITETQARAPALKATNDAVVALTHIGFTEDPGSVEVDVNVDTNLAAQVTGIDAIIGSHSHTNPSTGYGPYKFLPTFVGAPDNTPVIINQALRYNSYLGEVVLGMRAKTGGGYEVVARAGKYIQVTTSIAEDAAVKAIVKPYDDFLTLYKTRQVGQTTVPIDTLNAYTQETNGANLQADASIWKLNSVFGAGYVNAHLSGAMTNAKIAASATSSTPYTMTVNDMFTLMPYENSLVVFRLNGPQLKTILERAYRNYWYYKYGGSSHGGYSYYTTCMLDVSAGGVITYDEDPLTYTVGSNYVVGFSINGNPVDFLDATTYYTISTVNYIAAGSCNFNNGGVTLWPLDQIVQDTQYYVRDVVIEYIPTLTQPIAPAIEGRLVFQ